MGNRNTTPPGYTIDYFDEINNDFIYNDPHTRRRNSDDEYDVPPLPEMEDGPDSWYNDPTIPETQRNRRLQSRADRQNREYRRNPYAFNRREWRQRDEERMREQYDRGLYDTPQRVQAEDNRDPAWDRDRRLANLDEARELPQRRITLQSLLSPRPDMRYFRDEPPNRAEQGDLDSADSDSSSDDDTMTPIQPYTSDVPSNFAERQDNFD